MSVYGNYRVIRVHATGGVMRVLVEDLTTHERSYRVIPYQEA